MLFFRAFIAGFHLKLQNFAPGMNIEPTFIQEEE
jgi:hypothetical protein